MTAEITPEELQGHLSAQGRVTLLDVREPWECQISRFEGSKHIPMGEIPSRAHQELDPDAHIVVVCHHGVRSLNVTHWLRREGFENVQSLRGGIDLWSRTVDPTIPVY
jgi:rhodanese-related sulfurtransferase